MPLRKLTQRATEVLIKGRKMAEGSSSVVDPEKILQLLQLGKSNVAAKFMPELIGEWEWSGEPVSLERILLTAYEEARRAGSIYVGTEHLFLALVGLRSSENLEEARQQVSKIQGLPKSNFRSKGDQETPLLDSFGTDLVELAQAGDLPPLVSRKNLLEQIVRILLRKKKNNPVLIGDSGVGKTSIVYCLAKRIASMEVPRGLVNKRIVRFDLPLFLANFSPNNNAESGFSSFLQDVRKVGDIILFIDELHTLMGKGSVINVPSGMVNVLKEALDDPQIQIIGALDSDSYSQHLEFDQALVRRLELVHVEEPGFDETHNILSLLKPHFEDYHSVSYKPDVLQASIKLSERYLPSRNFPDKAIAVLDEAGAYVRSHNDDQAKKYRETLRRVEKTEDELYRALEDQEFDEALKLRKKKDQLSKFFQCESSSLESLPVDVDVVENVIAEKTGIPITKLNREEEQKYREIEEFLGDRVIGQNHAIRVLSQVLRRSRVGLTDPARPFGSFLFLGPTGVGKTELARVLAEFLFGSKEALVRLDMSEFRERHTAARLVGAPPGYVGHGQGGELTEAIRRNPYNIVLFDEMEKAHPEVLNLLLQILEEGELRDGQGRVADFSNTVVILTSNVGAELISRGELGFSSTLEAKDDYEVVKNRLLDNVKKEIRPEFLNRLDDILVFRSLDFEDILGIVDLQLEELKERLAGRKLELEITDSAKKLLAEMGYSEEYGARPLKRKIQKEIEAPVSMLLVEGKKDQGDTVEVGTRKEAITVE